MDVSTHMGHWQDVSLLSCFDGGASAHDRRRGSVPAWEAVSFGPCEHQACLFAFPLAGSSPNRHQLPWGPHLEDAACLFQACEVVQSKAAVPSAVLAGLFGAGPLLLPARTDSPRGAGGGCVLSRWGSLFILMRNYRVGGGGHFAFSCRELGPCMNEHLMTGGHVESTVSALKSPDQ